MSWRDAPLYIESHDLAVWVLGRCAGWSEPGLADLRSETSRSAIRLVEDVALALTFPAGRSRHLERADQGIVRLRIALRLARDLGALEDRQLRHASKQLRSAGRMLGGWRKRIDKDPPAPSPGPEPGGAPPAARTG